MKAPQEFYSWYVVNCVFNVFLSYTAIMLNIVTIQAIRKTPSLSKPLKTLLLSLAVSDLGVGLTAQPLFVTVRIMELKQSDNSRTYYATKNVFLVLANLFSSASCFVFVVLITDRFLAIRLQYLRYQELVTHKRIVAVVISIWVFSAILSLIRLWIPSNIIYFIFAILFFVCASTVALLSFKTYTTARGQINQIQVMGLTVQQVAQNGEMAANVERLRKFAMAAIYVCLVFMVCYLPFVCMLWIIAITSAPVNIAIPFYTLTLLFLNSSLNPLIYCWKMRHIRNTVMNILRNACSNQN